MSAFLLARGLVDGFLSCRFSHAPHISFLLDASECRYLTQCYESKRDAGQSGTALAVEKSFSYRAVLNSQSRSAKCRISHVKQHRRFIRSECSPVEDERCQKIGGGNRKFRFLLFL